MQGISRRQLITWAVVGLIILAVGGNYLRGQLSKQGSAALLARTSTVVDTELTVGEKDEPIKVHVAGAVSAPGIYELEEGDRVADALESAGGPLPDAAMDSINLAAVLMDGQQVFVPLAGQAGSAPAVAGGAATASPPLSGDQPINLNTATAEQLEQLDGVGEKTAAKIVTYREEHGGFASIEELMEVPGIGPAKFEGIKDSVTV